MVKNLPANAGHTGSIPGSDDPLKKEMATQSSILAWEIPWTVEPGSPWGRKELHMAKRLSMCTHSSPTEGVKGYDYWKALD